MDLVLVAAVADNGVIGDGRTVPWDLPEDVKQYRERVAGHPVVLGRKTFDMMRSNPVPASRVVVMSRSLTDLDEPDTVVASSVGEAVDHLESTDESVAYVIGGAAIYELFLPYADRMVLSEVAGEYDGDAYFPTVDEDDWREADRTSYDGFDVVEYVHADPEPVPDA
jgi:dihydrofolate reductase